MTEIDDSSSAGAAALERRKSQRSEFVVRVNYRTVDELFSEFARNINEGGIFVETENSQAIGNRVSLEFQIPGSSDPIQVSGTVVRSSDGSDGEPAGMGIEFEDLDSDARTLINDLVRKLRNEPAE